LGFEVFLTGGACCFHRQGRLALIPATWKRRQQINTKRL